MRVGKSIILLCCVLMMQQGFSQSFSAIDKHLESIDGRIQVSVQKYMGTELFEEHTANAAQPQLPPGWEIDLSARPVKGEPAALDIIATFKLRTGNSPSTAVSVSFDFTSWSRSNYTLVPAIVYNGNRYKSIGNGYNPDYTADMYYNLNVPLTISNNPRLEMEDSVPSLIELETANTATPSMSFYAPGKGRKFLLFTDQRSIHGNHGLSIRENATKDQCRFSVTAPAMRKRAAGFGDFHPSGDKAPDWKAGDQLSLVLRVYVQKSEGIPDLLTAFMQYRKRLSGENQHRNWLPMSHLSQLYATITSNNFREFPVGNYYLPENSKDFQLGWVSGMINTYPMLALNDSKERKRVSEELDFVVSKMQGKSGYFYGGITSEGKIKTEKMHPAFPEPQAMVRKNADVLFWLIKHLRLLKAQQHSDEIRKEWELATYKLAEAFISTWKMEGEFGQYIAPETGRIAVYNSTAGAMVPAGLALAADYFKKTEWLEIAKASAAYYYERDVVGQGLMGGDCGDISMDANSESAFGFLESLMTLYQVTGDRSWLKKAEVQAALCASWTISFDPYFPPNSQIGKLGSRMAGAVWASIQNKHAAPGICTSSGDYLFKLFRATGNSLYADLIRDIRHAHAEAVNIPPDHITTDNLPGSSMERIQPSDAEGRGSIGNYIRTRNSWTETNGALMALELPGIYVQPDKKLVRVFDHVEVRVLKSIKNKMTLAVKNPTEWEATVAVFSEKSRESKRPLDTSAFLDWKRITVPAGGELVVEVGDN